MEEAKKFNILAVDDTPSNIIALEAIFSGTDYHIVEARSGNEALDRLRERQDIVLVLLDVQMPQMDGFQTAMRIKQLPDYRDVPIIFITAVYNEDPFIKKGFESGAIDYFSKPFDPQILKLKVDFYSALGQKTRLLKERERRIRQAEKLVLECRQLFKARDALKTGVLLADEGGRILEANDVASRIIKSTGHETLWDILRNDVHHQSETLRIKCLDGSYRNILTSTSPLRSLEGELVGSVVVIQDVTETSKIEETFESHLIHMAWAGPGP